MRKTEFGDEKVIRLAGELKKLVPEIQTDEKSPMIAQWISASLLLPHLDRLLEIYDEAIERFRALDPAIETPEDELEPDED